MRQPATIPGMMLIFILLPQLLLTQGLFNPAREFQKPMLQEVGKKKAEKLGQAALADRNDLDINYYRCEWDVDPASRFITGKVTAVFTIIIPGAQLNLDLASTLIIDSIFYHQAKTGFTQAAPANLTINLPASLPAGRKDSVSIFYHGIPPANSSFVTSVTNGTPVLWTLSEPYGAKDWWPCKNNQSDKADSIDIYLRYPSRYKSSSNGLLVSQETGAGKTTAHWKHRYPISSYLVAMAITDYSIKTDTITAGGQRIPFSTYTYAADPNYLNEPHRLVSLLLQQFSALFGPYPFANESYSQTQFGAGGGMEHQTNSFITNNDGGTAGHELGHQWFGDKVTCRSWKDIWLNEGFASYLQYLSLEFNYPYFIPEHFINSRNIVIEQPGGSVRVKDTTDINKIFDFRLSYAKAHLVIHMIRWRLGDTLFFSAMRRYLNDPAIAYGVAGTEDLQRNLEQASGQNFAEFFRDWYEGEGHPNYQLSWSMNANNWLRIKLGQTSSHPSVSFFEMPVPVVVRGQGRDSLFVFDHKRNGEEFTVNPGFIPDTLIFDPNYKLLYGTITVNRESLPAGGSNQVRIYPNPAVQTLFVSLKNPSGKHLSIQLFNAAGQKIYTIVKDLAGSDELYPLNMKSYPAGFYWVRVQGDDFKMIKKILR